MKKKIQYFVAIALLALINFSTSSMAQPIDPPDGGGGDSPIGGGAPVGSGIYILVALALAYGISRWYANHRQKAVQE